jgi:hypothetical protein
VAGPFIKASPQRAATIDRVKNRVKNWGEIIKVGRFSREKVSKKAAMANEIKALGVSFWLHLELSVEVLEMRRKYWFEEF